jgi:hypothetical protein
MHDAAKFETGLFDKNIGLLMLYTGMTPFIAHIRSNACDRSRWESFISWELGVW